MRPPPPAMRPPPPATRPQPPRRASSVSVVSSPATAQVTPTATAEPPFPFDETDEDNEQMLQAQQQQQHSTENMEENPFRSLLKPTMASSRPVRKVSLTPTSLFEQLKSTSGPEVISPKSSVLEIKTTLARAHHVADSEAQRYGIFLNEDWMDEAPSFSEYVVKSTDNLSFMRMKKAVASAMHATVTPSNMKIISTTVLEANGNVNVPLIPGEKVITTQNGIVHIHLVSAGESGIVGCFYVTNYRIIFMPVVQSECQQLQKRPQCARTGFDVPLSSILSMNKCRGISAAIGKQNIFYCLVLQTKDFHIVRFSYLSQGKSSDFSTPDAILEGLIFHNSFAKLFAFNPDWVASFGPEAAKAWTVYDPRAEFQRIGVPCAKWRLTELNKNYEFSESYPALLCVPEAISDEELPAVFHFRSKGRIPALVWKHKNNAVLMRCSQPSVGITSQRCTEDERFVGAVGAANPNSRTVHIYDARPLMNARANTLKGMGYEYDKFYPRTVIQFLGCENIHKIREAESKLRTLCLNEPLAVVARKLVTTKWLYHMSKVLAGALIISQCVESGGSVIVHCSDGWDRTSQLTSLALIMLDSYYRTITGFQVLIEKEWVSFGHMFARRTSHVCTALQASDDATGAGEGSAHGDRAPIFPQFIDCVFQLMHHLRNAFEYNEAFLAAVMHGLYCCQYGTFVFDSEKARMESHASTRTVSLWSYIDANRALYVNKDYRPAQHISFHNTKGFSLNLWESYYLQWNSLHDANAESAMPFSEFFKLTPHQWCQV
eukprot:TRINITY_DN1554_c0_g1_i1.p1 TRINITY_DN1554_c0_g1~~TRINITY_DN1554_c0_g1_i1.p1  ORF type:complete len:774 (+),score=188.02 TRINITY_DN1554_c0_g1_i1:1479-3800(+)